MNTPYLGSPALSTPGMSPATARSSEQSGSLAHRNPVMLVTASLGTLGVFKVFEKDVHNFLDPIACLGIIVLILTTLRRNMD